MRLIGGKDYYDSALAYGHDPDLVFVRKKKEKIRAKKGPLFIPQPSLTVWRKDAKNYWSYKWTSNYKTNAKGEQFDFARCVVIVAGKKFCGYRITQIGNPDPKTGLTVKYRPVFYWTLEAFERWLDFCGFQYRDDYDRWYDKEYLPLGEYFGNKLSKHELDWLITNRVTIATWVNEYEDENCKDTFWHLDEDNLQTFNFAKVLDPYTAFQEISMWVGGVLPRDGNPMVEITDPKIKLAKHGMDKWSFRKQSARK